MTAKGAERVRAKRSVLAWIAAIGLSTSALCIQFLWAATSHCRALGSDATCWRRWGGESNAYFHDDYFVVVDAWALIALWVVAVLAVRLVIALASRLRPRGRFLGNRTR